LLEVKFLVNYHPRAFFPHVKEVVAEHLKLALQSLIVLAHLANLLLEDLDVSFGDLLERKFENLNLELHLRVVVEGLAIVFLLLDPTTYLLEELRVAVALASIFI
jgi:translation initiation factor RLI1